MVQFYIREYIGLSYIKEYMGLFYIRDYMGRFSIRDYKGLLYIRDYMGLFYIRDYMGQFSFFFGWRGFLLGEVNGKGEEGRGENSLWGQEQQRKDRQREG